MNILLATSWDTLSGCGIEAHSRLLMDAVCAADPTRTFHPSAEALDPSQVGVPDLLHLNYHRALHSRWTPETVRAQQAKGTKVVITFHDTFGENPPDTLAAHLCAAADAFVVHEPCVGLESAIYWRMGVPPLAIALTRDWNYWPPYRPMLGTIGFPFPWKNYDQLAQLTADLGWALLLITPTATAEQVTRWKILNPFIDVYTRFVDQREAVSLLSGCDATAFCYTCANSGQSGAILQGLAARKPVVAFDTCRQFRALKLDPLGKAAIYWCETFDDVAFTLMHAVPIARVDPRSVALAEQDSWAKLGVKYANLYRRLLGEKELTDGVR